MNDLTDLFERIDSGDSNAFDDLLPIVYAELRQLASRQMANESPGNTLQTTALVHEAYLRLVGNNEQKWNGRGHFFTAAAEAMRRILVERARRRNAIKRGGGQKRMGLSGDLSSNGPNPEEVIAVNDLVDRLADEHTQVAELFKLHYFAGFNLSEAGRAMGISSSTAHRHWVFAKAWLYEELKKES